MMFVRANSSHAPAYGDIPNRLVDLVAIAVMQQFVKLRRGLEQAGRFPAPSIHVPGKKHAAQI
jgi:hypothetical protein